MEDTTMGTQQNNGTIENDIEDLMIPKTRFDSVNTKYKETKKELEDLNNIYKELEGKSFELADALDKAQARNQALEKVIQTLVDAKLSKIPEEYHDLIPENLSVEEKLDWITKAEEKGLFSSAINVGIMRIGQPTNPSKQQTKDMSKFSPFQLLTMGYNSTK